MISSLTATRTFRTSIIGTVTDWLRALAIASFAATACAAPYVPKDDATVLERLPVRPGDPIARELRQLRTELAANPQKRETAVRLAERYFALATSEGAIKVMIHRLRRRYQQLLRAEIAATVSNEPEIDDEIRHLIAVLTD